MAGDESIGTGANVLRALAAALALLVVASAGYAVWIIIRYWGSVGV